MGEKVRSDTQSEIYFLKEKPLFNQLSPYNRTTYFSGGVYKALPLDPPPPFFSAIFFPTYFVKTFKNIVWCLFIK